MSRCFTDCRIAECKAREDLQFAFWKTIFLDGSEITITIDQKVRLMVEVIFKVLALYLFLFAVRLLIPTFNQFLIYFILVLLESIDYRFINLRKVLFWNKYENCTFTFHLRTKRLTILLVTVLVIYGLFRINYFGSTDFESWAILTRACCDIS